MQQVHGQYADTFGSLELGARFETRAIDPLSYGAGNVNIGAAPNAGAPAANVDVNAATQRDAEVNQGILADLKARQAGTRPGNDPLQALVDAVTATGDPTGDGMQQVWAAANQAQDGGVAIRNAVYGQLEGDLSNMNGSLQTQFQTTSLQDMFSQLGNQDAAVSQPAAEEVARRYASGLQVRGDLKLAESLEDNKLKQTYSGNNPNAAQDRQNATDALAKIRAQEKNVDANLGAMDNALKATGHGGTINGFRYGQAAGGINNDADAQQVIARAQADNKELLKDGLHRDPDGKVWTTIPAGGNFTNTMKQLGVTDEKVMQEICDLNGIGNRNQVNANQKIILPGDLVDGLANKYAPTQDTTLKANLGTEIDWLNRWMPIGGVDTGYKPGGDVAAQWAQYGTDSGVGAANVAHTLDTIKGDRDKSIHFGRFIQELYKANGKEAQTPSMNIPAGEPGDGSVDPNSNQPQAADPAAPAGQAGQPVPASIDAGVKQAVRTAMDAQGRLSIDGTEFSGNNYSEAEDKIKEDIAQQYNSNGNNVQQAIDTVFQSIGFSADNEDAKQVMSQNLKRDLYAAYGVQAATDRQSSGGGLAQGIADFIDGPGAAMWSGTGNVDDAAALKTGDVDKRAAELEGLKGKTKKDVREYVAQHYFVHREANSTFNPLGFTGTQDPQEGPLQQQLVNTICNSLGITD